MPSTLNGAPKFDQNRNRRGAEERVLHISDDAMRVLVHYDWPGNVRELKNAVERASALSKGTSITIEELPEEFQAYAIKQLLPQERRDTKRNTGAGNKGRSAEM